MNINCSTSAPEYYVVFTFLITSTFLKVKYIIYICIKNYKNIFYFAYKYIIILLLTHLIQLSPLKNFKKIINIKLNSITPLKKKKLQINLTRKLYIIVSINSTMTITIFTI